MSAFTVNKEHIDALVQAALWIPGPQHPGDSCNAGLTYNWPDADPELFKREGYEAWAIDAQSRYHDARQDTPDRLGQMLWGENHRSVNHRYQENHIEPLYSYQPLPGEPDPVIVIKAISCYEYQTCEHEGWETSEAHAFCKALRNKMINALPGYDAAPWGIDDRNVFATQ